MKKKVLTGKKFRKIFKMSEESAEERDSNVYSLMEKYRKRELMGKKKYGVTTDRTDLSYIDWLRHAQEEAMDLSIYLEKLIKMHDEVEMYTSTYVGSFPPPQETVHQ